MRILSLGAGVQSSAIAMMVEHGDLPPIDAAIFADTGWEPQAVYDQLDWLEEQVSFPIYRVSAGNIREDLIDGCSGVGRRYAAVPFFMSSGGLGQRQCTQEYKIAPVQKKIKELLGYEPKQRVRELVDLWIGISLDESLRMKPSRIRWIRHYYPLVEQRLTRQDCHQWFKRHGYPEPVKSSCIGCPFHNNQMWQAMKENNPDEFADAVFVDAVIRNGGARMKSLQYMHRDLKPLDQVEFVDKRQIDLFQNECTGFCGV